jgi:hypothetical protein
MIFVEYISRDRSVPIELFHKHAKQDWVAGEDQVVASLARMNKLAPEPHYMCWWKIDQLRRVDQWHSFYTSDAGRLHLARSADAKVLTFQQHGLYDAIVGGEVVAPGLHIVEYFEADAVSSEDVRQCFEARAEAARPGRLDTVLKRLGLLAPDPGGIALWTFGSLAEAEPFLRAPRPAAPLRIAAQGVYRPMGEEGT